MGEIVEKMSGGAERIERALPASRWRQAQGLVDHAKGNFKGAIRRITVALKKLAEEAKQIFTGKSG